MHGIFNAVNGEWTAWTRWLDCSSTCGNGTQRRYRVCDGATNGGAACAGDTVQYQNCTYVPCPGKPTILTCPLFSSLPLTFTHRLVIKNNG